MKRNADGSLKSRVLRHRSVSGTQNWACSMDCVNGGLLDGWTMDRVWLEN